MKLPPDTLNSWLNEHHFATPAPAYDLAASTGPVWTLDELLALAGEPLPDLDLSYVHSTGGRELRPQQFRQFLALSTNRFCLIR